MQHQTITDPHPRPIDSPVWRDAFRRAMAERRAYRRGTMDHDHLSRSARKFVWLMRGKPSNEWSE